jgi:hypothetical protein
MTEALTTIASAVTAADITAADAFGGFLALVVGIISFLAVSGLALSMTIGASKSPGTTVITAIAGVLSLIVAVGLYMVLTGSHALKLEDCPTATWDKIGAILAIIVGTLSFLALGGIAVVMMIGTFMPNKQPVSSWSMEQEQSFVGYDSRYLAAQSRAWALSVVAGVLVFVFAVGIYKGVTPEDHDLSKDMNMSNLTKKSSKPDAPAPKAEEAPKAEAAPKAE